MHTQIIYQGNGKEGLAPSSEIPLILDGEFTENAPATVKITAQYNGRKLVKSIPVRLVLPKIIIKQSSVSPDTVPTLMIGAPINNLLAEYRNDSADDVTVVWELVQETEPQGLAQIIAALAEEEKSLDELENIAHRVAPQLTDAISAQKKNVGRERRYLAGISSSIKDAGTNLLAKAKNTLERVKPFIKKIRSELAGQIDKQLTQEEQNLKQAEQEIPANEVKIPQRRNLKVLLDELKSAEEDVAAARESVQEPAKLPRFKKSREYISRFAALWQNATPETVLQFAAALLERVKKLRIFAVSQVPKTKRAGFSIKKFAARAALIAAGTTAVFLGGEGLWRWSFNLTDPDRVAMRKEAAQLKNKSAAQIVAEYDLKIPQIVEDNKVSNPDYATAILYNDTETLADIKPAMRGPVIYPLYAGETLGQKHTSLRVRSGGPFIDVDPDTVFNLKAHQEHIKKVGRTSGMDALKEKKFLAVLETFANTLSQKIFSHRVLVVALYHYHDSYFVGVEQEKNPTINDFNDSPHFSKYRDDIFISSSQKESVYVVVNNRALFTSFKERGVNTVLLKYSDRQDTGSLAFEATRRGIPYVQFVVPVGDSGSEIRLFKELNEMITHTPQLARDIDFKIPQA